MPTEPPEAQGVWVMIKTLGLYLRWEKSKTALNYQKHESCVTGSRRQDDTTITILLLLSVSWLSRSIRKLNQTSESTL